MSTAQEDILSERRACVAAVRLRGGSIRMIQRKLEEEGKLNPKTGAVWSVGTIQSDLTALDKEWRAEAARDIAALKGQLHAELDEVKRAAWNKDDLYGVLRVIEQQRKLLGADAPQVNLHQLGGIPGGEPIQTKSLLDGIDIKKLNIEQLNALESSLAAIDGIRTSSEGAV